jgi:GT2 family glycosyltransferase
MVTRTAIVRAGLLDERYFMYWEETDWCRRIRDTGMTLWFEPASCVQHKAPIHHQEMSALPLYYMGRNRVLFFGRHTPWPRKPIAIGVAGRGLLHGILFNARHGRRDVANSAAAAVRDALLLRWGPRTAVVPTSAANRTLDSRAVDGKS